AYACLQRASVWISRHSGEAPALRFDTGLDWVEGAPALVRERRAALRYVNAGVRNRARWAESGCAADHLSTNTRRPARAGRRVQWARRGVGRPSRLLADGRGLVDARVEVDHRCQIVTVVDVLGACVHLVHEQDTGAGEVLHDRDVGLLPQLGLLSRVRGGDGLVNPFGCVELRE